MMAVDRDEEDMKDYEFYDTDREEDSDVVDDDDDDHDDDDDDNDDDDDDQDDQDNCDNDDDTAKAHEEKNLTGTWPSICCKYKCVSMFDDEFKSRLKSELSKLSVEERRIFLFAMISINEKKKKISKSTKSSKYFEYTVREYGVLRSVCKTAFIHLHDTTLSWVRTLCMKMAANYLIPVDKRGKHDQQPTISEQSKELIKTHFFSTLESPIIFKCSKKRSGTPNISQLWLDYRKKHGNLSRSTYTKYIRSFLTPDILSKFMCANEAQLLLMRVKKY